jgi:hypothetical protein
MKKHHCNARNPNYVGTQTLLIISNTPKTNCKREEYEIGKAKPNH